MKNMPATKKSSRQVGGMLQQLSNLPTTCCDDRFHKIFDWYLQRETNR